MGVTVDEKDKESYEARLCPDVSQMMKHLYRIKNTYGDQKERISFSVEIEKCENKQDPTYCKRDQTMKDFLNNIYFTLYYTQEHVNLKSKASNCKDAD
jgi:hypothetical protein